MRVIRDLPVNKNALPRVRLRWRVVAATSEIGTNTMFMLGMPTLTQLAWAVFIVLSLVVLEPLVLGAVFIRERQLGVVVKKLGSRSLSPERFIALAGKRATRPIRFHRACISDTSAGSTASSRCR